MATDKQIAANRANAQLSTGPKTPEGKAKSRLNARRDGLTGQVICLAEEEMPVFITFRKNYGESLQPVGMAEAMIADAMAWDTWRLNKLRAIEANLYSYGSNDANVAIEFDNPQIFTAMSDAITFTKQASEIARLSLHEQRLNRSIERNRAALKAMQDERKALREKDLEDEMIMARANEYKEIPYEAPTRPSKNGFSFSTDEVKRAANRRTVNWDARMTVSSQPYRIQYAGIDDDNNPGGPNTGLKVAKAA